MHFTDVCYVTKDVRRLATFYERIFQVQAQGDPFHATLCAPGLKLTFDSVHSLKETESFAHLLEAQLSTAILGFQVEDVDKEYERLLHMQVPILHAPVTHPWGMRSFQFKDPDGNLINFRAPVA